MKRLLLSLDSLNDIIALQGIQCVGYCEAVLSERCVVFGGSIANLSNYLDARFIRISRTVLVNKNHIVQFDEKTVSLSNGQLHNISRRRKKQVLVSLNS